MECWAPLAPAPFQFFIILNNCCTLRQMVDDGDRAVVLLILYITYHSISVHIPSHDRWRDRDLYTWGIMGSTRSEWFIEYNCRWFATVIYGFRVGWNWWSMDRDGSMDEVTTDDLLHIDDQMGRDCNTKNFVQTTNTTSKYVTIRTTLSTQQITSQPALTMRCVCTVSPIGHIAYLTITSRIDRSLEISNEWKCNGNRHRDGCKKSVVACMPLRSGYIYYCNWTR